MEEGKAIELTDANFEEEVLKSEVPVLVDFWATWCGPCQAASPVLDKIAGEYTGRLKVCKLNVDEQRQTAIEHGIMSIPTLKLYKGGEEVDQIGGVTPSYEQDIKKRIEPYLKN